MGMPKSTPRNLHRYPESAYPAGPILGPGGEISPRAADAASAIVGMAVRHAVDSTTRRPSWWPGRKNKPSSRNPVVKGLAELPNLPHELNVFIEAPNAEVPLDVSLVMSRDGGVVLQTTLDDKRSSQQWQLVGSEFVASAEQSEANHVRPDALTNHYLAVLGRLGEVAMPGLVVSVGS